MARASKPISHQDGVDQVRVRIVEKKAQETAIRRAPPPESEIREAIDRWVRSRAAEFRPRLDGSGFPLGLFLEAPGNPGVQVADARDLEALVCAIAGEAVEEALLERAKARFAGQEPGLPRAERAEALDTIAAELLALEVAEEAAIEAAAAEGVVIERRADAAPQAVLGLADVA